ncbi:MAG TPA: Fe-S cluster assembly protein SufD [Kiritimatiellia bacterium]|nr:Fe-S cluster assembly protein SufD [Kiritimatiellia bacterium]
MTPLATQHEPAALNPAAFQDILVSTATTTLKEKRQAAFNAFSALPWPTQRDEEWRRTDPASLPLDRFHSLPVLEPVASADEHELDALFDVVVSVHESGYSIRDRSGAGSRITVQSLADAARDHHEAVSRYLHGPALIEENRKFTELNGAFWNFGLFIRIPANLEVENGVLVRYRITRPYSLLIPKLVVVAESGSRANVVEVFHSEDDCPVFTVSARELYVEQAARLQVFSLQEWGRTSFHVGEDWGHVERDAQIDWVTLTLGSQVSKSTMGCNVSAPNANAYLSGLFFADRDQHVDQRTLQQHASPHTYSNLLYKGAVKDQGHSVYQGIIAAKPGAIDVDAYQMNNNLVLNSGAKADSLPGLKIDADDLKCSHGSTMGNLDPDQLFYLQSRGFSNAEARRTLVLAFFEEIIAKIPYAFMQDRVRADVNRKI